MCSLRSLLSTVLSIPLAMCSIPPGFPTHLPLGVLTQAERAHLNESVAFPGLSVFEGEHLSTEVGGRLGVRAGRSTLILGGKTEVTLLMITGGIHADLGAGSLYVSTAEKEVTEVQAEDAMLRPEGNQPTQAAITILAPKVLQIAARKGGLNFSYREEFRNLAEGETYRIYLEAPTGPKDTAGTAGGTSVGGQKAGAGTKVAYFIVAAGAAEAASAATWGITKTIHSNSESTPISPAKP